MIRKMIIAATASLALVGCQTVSENQQTAIGAVAGAAIGAAAGTLVGGNDRRNALIGAGIGLLAGAAVGQYLDQQQRELEAGLAGTGAEVERQGDQLLVNLPSQITFDTGKSEIKPQFYSALDQVAATFNKYPESYIDVIGHTDSQGSIEYNQGLSERRAAAVSSYLGIRGVSEARLAQFGQGETAPVASNDTPEGRAANRRVELRITPATQG
ncbi:MAG: OmpA family protein [Pseudomonadota bacterium]